MGRPLIRDMWAASLWDALWAAPNHCLTPREAREETGLTQNQLHAAAQYLRDTFSDEPDPPVVYVRNENHWYIAPTWGEHVRHSVRSEYLQQSARRLESAEHLLEKSVKAFPSQARRIRKVLRNTHYLREEIDDLLVDMR
jgi:8-oxo-dGTP pyrophosphatase MutT (NUDIX family)